MSTAASSVATAAMAWMPGTTAARWTSTVWMASPITTTTARLGLQITIAPFRSTAAQNRIPSTMTENATADDGSCIPIVYGCLDPTHPNYDPSANTHSGCEEEKPKALASSLITVTGGQFVAISCVNPMTVLQLLSGDQVIFAILCGYEAMLDAITEDELPGALPDGNEYASGLNVALMQAGNAVDKLPSGTDMTVSFTIPAGMEAETFAILHWDGSSWVEESVSVENGYVKAASSNTGAFVLVVK